MKNTNLPFWDFSTYWGMSEKYNFIFTIWGRKNTHTDTQLWIFYSWGVGVRIHVYIFLPCGWVKIHNKCDFLRLEKIIRLRIMWSKIFFVDNLDKQSVFSLQGL